MKIIFNKLENCSFQLKETVNFYPSLIGEKLPEEVIKHIIEARNNIKQALKILNSTEPWSLNK